MASTLIYQDCHGPLFCWMMSEAKFIDSRERNWSDAQKSKHHQVTAKHSPLQHRDFCSRFESIGMPFLRRKMPSFSQVKCSNSGIGLPFSLCQMFTVKWGEIDLFPRILFKGAVCLSSICPCRSPLLKMNLSGLFNFNLARLRSQYPLTTHPRMLFGTHKSYEIARPGTGTLSPMRWKMLLGKRRWANFFDTILDLI